MKEDEPEFLGEMAHANPENFDEQFTAISGALGLDDFFSRNEWTLLYEASQKAVICSAALNSPDVSGAEVRPEQERQRQAKEIEFLAARDSLFASPAWQELSVTDQDRLVRTFLTVCVSDHKLLKSAR